MKRGRKSQAELATVAVVDPDGRPDAPYDLTDYQADEWRTVVNRMPSGWFPRETWDVL